MGSGCISRCILVATVGGLLRDVCVYMDAVLTDKKEGKIKRKDGVYKEERAGRGRKRCW